MAVDGSNNQMYMVLDGDRITSGKSYTFSVWIARDPEGDRVTGSRTHNYVRLRWSQRGGGGSRKVSAIYNLDDGTVTQTTNSDGGSTIPTDSVGVESFTAATGLNTTETQIWDRVYVTIPYDGSYATEGLNVRLYPVCASSGAISSPGDRGGLHVWGPMVVEGTSPVSHLTSQWPQGAPYGHSTTIGWDGFVWLDGKKGSERTGVSTNRPNTDSPLPKALEEGDEVFFSIYIGKAARDGTTNIGPTDYDPNPTSVNGRYHNGYHPWTVASLRNKDDNYVEYIVLNSDISTPNFSVKSQSTGPDGLNIQSQSGDPAGSYGNAVIYEDAGDYWRVGVWLKHFGVDGAGRTPDMFMFAIDAAGSSTNHPFQVGRYVVYTGAELFINSGVHPNAPGGLQFPTPTLKPHEPNAGSCLSIAVPPKSVEVDEGALNDDSEFEEKQKSPEFVYFTQKGNEPTQYDKMIRKHRVVAATPMLEDDQSPRANKLISVNNGSLYKVQTPSEGGSSYTAITSGDSVLSADASQIQWVQHQDKLYFVDGKRTIVYDPVLETVNDLESKKAGTVPSKPRLIASWRNRLVLARTVDEPHNWHMSAVGDAENWDYFPALPVVTQAVSGNNARAGLAADMINTLIPYNDDLMIMGGDHSISRMTGDPMAGGQIDVISQTIGMAFGQSWTMDPEGVLYFVSTESRIYAMTPDGKIQKISNKYIEDAVLEHWNESEFRMKLVWNSKDGGLHVLFLPNSLAAGQSAGIGVDALFYERVNNAWWRDQFAAEVVPYSAIVRDGDSPQDRTVLFVNEDGTVLNWAKQSVNSTTITDYNDNAINAWVFIDIASETSSQSETLRCTSVETIMSHYTQDAKIRLYADDNPLTLPDSEAAVEWAPPGRSGRLPLRAKGANLGLKISATGASGAFSTESIHVTLTKAGRSRV